MRAAKGFKHTDVGTIPQDWDLIPYGKAFEFLNTATYSRSQLSENGDIEYIHYGDIHTRWKHFLDLEKDGLPKISNKQLKNYSLIRNGDVLMADASEDMKGVGTSVEVKNIEDRKVISGLHTFLMRDKGVFVDGFRAYIHLNEIVKNQFAKLATGVKVFGVSKTNLKKVLIPLPPTKKEQTAIATILSETDALISLIEKLISKKLNIKHGAIQKLLTGKQRIKGFSGNWVVKKLKKICWYQEGPGLRQWQFTKQGIKVINVTNLEGGYLNLNNTSRFISYKEFEKMYRHFEIDANDIVVASSGNTYCKTAVVRSKDLPLLMNTSVIRFKPNPELDYYFLLSFLKSNLFKNQIDLLITGGAQPNFGPAHLKKIEINLPPTKDEQIAISSVLRDIDIEIEQLLTQLSKYKLLKQGVMQNLLTGKVRLI